VVGRVATVVGKGIYKATGIQSMVSCATNPSVASCVEAGVSLVLDVSVIATAGTDSGAVVGAEALEEGAVGAGEAAAQAAAGSTLKNAALQMAIGGVTTAVGNTLSGAMQGQSGWKLVEDAGAGLVTGAIGNTPLGGAAGAFAWGMGGGGLNAYLMGGINDHKSFAHPDINGIENDALLGGMDNNLGSGITNWGNRVKDSTADTMGNAFSGVASAAASGVCGFLDHLKVADC
jgi:hypothetical protein